MKRIQYNSPVILTYALISLLVLCAAYFTGGESSRLLFSVYRSSYTDPLTYVRIVGHIFGHYSFQHYFNNFIIILLVGPILEEKYGSLRMLLMILATALITGLLTIWISPNVMLMGASGIAFMLIILSSFVNLQRGKIPLTLILIVVIYIGQEVVAGVSQVDNISHATHIAGGICGAVLGFFINYRMLGKKEKAEKAAELTEEKSEEPEAKKEDEDKIYESEDFV